MSKNLRFAIPVTRVLPSDPNIAEEAFRLFEYLKRQLYTHVREEDADANQVPREETLQYLSAISPDVDLDMLRASDSEEDAAADPVLRTMARVDRLVHQCAERNSMDDIYEIFKNEPVMIENLTTRVNLLRGNMTEHSILESHYPEARIPVFQRHYMEYFRLGEWNVAIEVHGRPDAIVGDRVVEIKNSKYTHALKKWMLQVVLYMHIYGKPYGELLIASNGETTRREVHMSSVYLRDVHNYLKRLTRMVLSLFEHRGIEPKLSPPYRYHESPVLDAQQLAIAESPSRLVGVCAHPGTGKTRVLMHRLHRLALRGESVLALGFSRAAVGEMRDRLDERAAENVHIMTIDSFAYSVWRVFCGSDTSEKALYVPGSQSWKKLSAVMRERNVHGPDFRVRKHVPGYLQEMWSEYELEKEMTGTLDYYDIMRIAHKMIQDPRIWRHIGANFDHVFMDECQDSSEYHAAFMSLFYDRGKGIFVIGDPHQRIFEWSGHHGLVMDLVRQMGGDMFTLSRNYRSDPAIVKGAGVFLEKSNVLESTDYPGKGVIFKVESANYRVVECCTVRQEVEYIVYKIQELVSTGYAYADIAILVRSRNAFGGLIQNLLQEAGIPCHSYLERDGTELIPADPDGVHEMTLHASKGREFPVVFIPGVANWCNRKKELRSEFRLFYVGMTRAEQKLFVTYSDTSQTAYIPNIITKS